LIGCGVVLAVLIAVVVFFGAYFVKEMKKMEAEFNDVTGQYAALEREHPFEAYPGRNLSPLQVSRFTGCRRALLAPLAAWEKQLMDQDVSTFTKIASGLGNMTALGQAHAKALAEQQMSPTEYVWILNRVLAAIKYGERDDAPEALKDLRSAFERAANAVDIPIRSPREDGAAQPVLGFSGGEVEGLLPRIDPTWLSMPESTLQAVLENAPGLKETLRIFFVFDYSFREVHHTLPRMEPGDPASREDTPDAARNGDVQAPAGEKENK
jgi:hypothetical protein